MYADFAAYDILQRLLRKWLCHERRVFIIFIRNTVICRFIDVSDGSDFSFFRILIHFDTKLFGIARLLDGSGPVC